jgi:hypothetical protein
MDYMNDVNLWYEPQSLFKRPDLDYYTMWLYMQKADDSDLKDKILQKLQWLLVELWEWEPQLPGMENPVANSAANIMMAQWMPTDRNELITRDTVNLNSNIQ